MSYFSSNCKKGCLLCSEEICLYCDKKQNYYRVGTICTKKILDNCQQSDNGETCTLCNSGYYVDYSTGKCKKATEDITIVNCKTYKLLKECYECNENYYLLKNECLEVETKIDNCIRYNSKNTCSICKDGMRLEDNACITIPFKNCMTIGTIRCSECKEDYLLFENTYLYNFNNWNKDKKKKMDIYELKGEYYNICAPLKLDHCIKYKTFYQCRECEKGYYLTPEENCEEIPEERIENCLEYLKINYCRICMDGYYLQITNQNLANEGVICLAHSKTVDLCKVMSNSNKDVCAECQSGYYLESNICVKRTLDIKNCSVYNINTDSCLTCVENFITNQENTNCFAKIENCQEIIRNINELSCAQCNPQYYYKIDEKKCISVVELQKISNCQYYNEKEDKSGPDCTQCADTYYLNINNGVKECLAHSSFTTNKIICSKWSYIKKNVCEKCDSFEKKFYTTNFCDEVKITYYDENALYYSYNQADNRPESNICKEGFFLKNQDGKKQCFKISTNYCKKTESEGKTCTECSSSALENYFLNNNSTNNLCLISYEHIIKNCFQRNQVESFLNNTLNYNTCKQCYYPYYPAYFLEAQFCVPKDRIKNNFADDSTNIDKCKIFRPEDDFCEECTFDEGEQLVTIAGKCTTTCSSSQQIQTKVFELINDLNYNFLAKKINKFTCQDDNTIYGCKRFSIVPENYENLTTAGNTSKKMCMECKTNLLPLSVFSSANKFQFADQLAYLPAKATQHFKAKSLSFESSSNRVVGYFQCIELEKIESGGTFHEESVKNLTFEFANYTPSQTDYRFGSNIWNTCKAFAAPQNNKYFCEVCKFGFTGVYLPFNDDQTKYLISNCVLNDTCDYGVYFMGLNKNYLPFEYSIEDNGIPTQKPILKEAFLNYWVTCHSCVDSNLIPTFALTRIGLTLTVNNVSKSIFQSLADGESVLLKNAVNKILPQTFCGKKGFIENAARTSLINTNFPANCGIQMLRTDIPLKLFNQNASDSNPICVACKPGFKPTVLNSDARLIINCVEITNCDSEKGLTTFNKCLRCLEGWALNATNDLCQNFENNPNCYKGRVVNSLNICDECIVGYAPDPTQQFCNEIELQNCINQTRVVFNKSNDIVMYKGTGCMECDLGYIATKMNQPQKVCIKSKEIQERKGGVADCFIYEGINSCYQCSVGFVIPINNKKKCILSSSIENCEDYEEILVANQVNKLGDMICKKCNESYVLVNGSCEDGSIYISNCLRFENNTNTGKCTQCKEGYVILENAGKFECYEVGSKLKFCLQYELINSKIKCNLCQTNYYPKIFEQENVNMTDPINIGATLGNFQLKFCLTIPEVKNCSYYNASQLCEYCYDDYWLKPGDTDNLNKIQSCVKRTSYPYSQCNIIDQKKDSCKQCLNSYFVKNNKCDFKPRGIIGCVIYSNSETCLKCKNNQYVLGNLCRTVPTENLISKCLYYSNEVNCSDCEKGYLLIANLCKAILISDCEVYETEKTCKICASQFFLSEQKTCEAGQVSSCKIHATQKTCQRCEKNFYVNSEQQCSAIVEKNLIDNCKYYANSSKCQICENGTLLQKNGESCIVISQVLYPLLFQEMDSYCNSYIYDVHCRVCQPGYKFDFGECKACSANLSNCHFCDYKDDSLCHVCQTNFYQTQKNQCVSSGETNEAVKDDTNTPTEWTYFSSGLIFYSFFWIFLLDKQLQ